MDASLEVVLASPLQLPTAWWRHLTIRLAGAGEGAEDLTGVRGVWSTYRRYA